MTRWLIVSRYDLIHKGHQETDDIRTPSTSEWSILEDPATLPQPPAIAHMNGRLWWLGHVSFGNLAAAERDDSDVATDMNDGVALSSSFAWF